MFEVSTVWKDESERRGLEAVTILPESLDRFAAICRDRRVRGPAADRRYGAAPARRSDRLERDLHCTRRWGRRDADVALAARLRCRCECSMARGASGARVLSHHQAYSQSPAWRHGRRRRARPERAKEIRRGARGVMARSSSAWWLRDGFGHPARSPDGGACASRCAHRSEGHLAVPRGSRRARRHRTQRLAIPCAVLEAADAYVFTRLAYAFEGLPAREVAIIPPSIDVFAPKNQELTPDQVGGILAAAKLVECPERRALYAARRLDRQGHAARQIFSAARRFRRECPSSRRSPGGTA